MAETEARIGYGSTIEISTDDGASYVLLAEVTNIKPPSDSLDIIEATHMASPNATKEFILGLNDPGECSFDINFVPGGDTDAKLQAVKAARLRVRVRLTFPNLVKWTFGGILTGYEPDVPTDDKMTAAVTWKVTSSYGIS